MIERAMYNLQEHLAESFPFTEKYIDCTGTERTFHLSVRSLPVGFVVEANEVTDAEYGYEFSEYAEADPYHSLGKLRGKIRKGISQRFLVQRQGETQLAHDELVGVISHLGLVVDGSLVPWADLQRMLTTCEGFPIKIQIM
jgi:hypothetical protein